MLEDGYAQKLSEELLAVYQKDVVGKPTRLPAFLAILRLVRPGLSGSGRLLQWWDLLSVPVMEQLGEQKALAAEARDTLLNILVYDEDEKNLDDAVATSNTMAENLMSTWLQKAAPEAEFDDEAQFVGKNLRRILLTFGKKRPKVGGWMLSPAVMQNVLTGARIS